MKLYTYVGTMTVDGKLLLGDDPHGRILDLDKEDWNKYGAVKPPWPSDRDAIGEFVEVTNVDDGEWYMVASAPCGLGCHCAAVSVHVPNVERAAFALPHSYALDQLAGYLAEHDDWSGADFCDLAADLLTRTGRKVGQ